MYGYLDDVKRTETMTFVTTRKQRNEILRAARIDEMTISEYLRNLVRQDLGSPSQIERRYAIETERGVDSKGY